MLHMLKNLILRLFLIIFLFSSTAFAQSGFYLTLGTGLNKMNNFKGSISKQKSIQSPLIRGGIGYYIEDDLRTDLVFDYSVNSYHRNYHFISAQIPGIHTQLYHAYIHSIIASLYKDIYTNEKFNVFVGGGIGAAQIHEKIIWTLVYNNNMLPNSSGKIGRKIYHNFAYSLTTGTVIHLNDRTNIELAYQWKDFGKTGPHMINRQFNIPKNRYSAHIGTVSIMFLL